MPSSFIDRRIKCFSLREMLTMQWTRLAGRLPLQIKKNVSFYLTLGVFKVVKGTIEIEKNISSVGFNSLSE